MKEIIKSINSFSGQYQFLSNFALYNPYEYMRHRGIVYHSNEHFYQALKFEDLNIRKDISKHPLKGLKRFVYKIDKKYFVGKDRWDEIKLRVMWTGINYKFNQQRYKFRLLLTGSDKLIEGNTWGDTYWGVYNGKGKNMLGKLLMRKRQELFNNLEPDDAGDFYFDY